MPFVDVTDARNVPDLGALGCLSNAAGLRRDFSFNRARDEPQELRSQAEKLIAAAHAGCFSMAHSGQLAWMPIQKKKPNRIAGFLALFPLESPF